MEDQAPYRRKLPAVSNPEFVRMPLILLELEPCVLLSRSKIKKLITDNYNPN